MSHPSSHQVRQGQRGSEGWVYVCHAPTAEKELDPPSQADPISPRLCQQLLRMDRLLKKPGGPLSPGPGSAQQPELQDGTALPLLKLPYQGLIAPLCSFVNQNNLAFCPGSLQTPCVRWGGVGTRRRPACPEADG
jgi:hypothetical protein